MAQSNTKIDTKMVKWDESPKLDPKMVKWDEAKAPNPTDDMSGTERVVAGYGKAAMDTYRGLRQFHGLMSPVSRFYNEATGLQGQIDEAKKTDKALMDTSGGFWGNIAGNVANLLPTAFLPGSATVPGSALVGSLTGAIQPVASDESRAQNAAVGGVLGPVATLAGRGAGALWQGGKALVEPFSQSGRDKIAGRVLERFIDDGNTLRGATSAATVKSTTAFQADWRTTMRRVFLHWKRSRGVMDRKPQRRRRERLQASSYMGRPSKPTLR
jgi:hypothetical protein